MPFVIGHTASIDILYLTLIPSVVPVLLIENKIELRRIQMQHIFRHVTHNIHPVNMRYRVICASSTVCIYDLIVYSAGIQRAHIVIQVYLDSSDSVVSMLIRMLQGMNSLQKWLIT